MTECRLILDSRWLDAESSFLSRSESFLLTTCKTENRSISSADRIHNVCVSSSQIWLCPLERGCLLLLMGHWVMSTRVVRRSASGDHSYLKSTRAFDYFVELCHDSKGYAQLVDLIKYVLIAITMSKSDRLLIVYPVLSRWNVLSSVLPISRLELDVRWCSESASLFQELMISSCRLNEVARVLRLWSSVRDVRERDVQSPRKDFERYLHLLLRLRESEQIIQKERAVYFFQSYPSVLRMFMCECDQLDTRSIHHSFRSVDVTQILNWRRSSRVRRKSLNFLSQNWFGHIVNEHTVIEVPVGSKSSSSRKKLFFFPPLTCLLIRKHWYMEWCHESKNTLNFLLKWFVSIVYSPLILYPDDNDLDIVWFMIVDEFWNYNVFDRNTSIWWYDSLLIDFISSMRRSLFSIPFGGSLRRGARRVRIEVRIDDSHVLCLLHSKSTSQFLDSRSSLLCIDPIWRQ